MTRLFQPWICLSLLVIAACERPEKTGRHAEERASPQVTRSAKRQPREALPEPHKPTRATLAEAQAITEPAARARAIAQVVWNALEEDPELAREALGLLAADSPERIALIQHFAMRMADENPDAALEWAGTLESEQESAAARARIALVIAAEDPTRAANLLSESGIPGREFDVAIVQVLQRWAGKSAPDAAAWVATFPPGGFRKAGIEAVVSQWAASDPQAVFSWLSTLSDESIRGEATLAIAGALGQQTLETRAVWLNAADPRTREQLEQAQPPAE
jgi:hypothetical protein